MEASSSTTSFFWSHLGNIKAIKVLLALLWNFKNYFFLALPGFPQIGFISFYVFCFVLFSIKTWSSLVISYIFLSLILKESCGSRQTWQTAEGGGGSKGTKMLVTSIRRDNQPHFLWAGPRGHWGRPGPLPFSLCFLSFFVFLWRHLVY